MSSKPDPASEAHELLMSQLARLTTGPDWQAMLDMAARFHTYSARNVMLLAAQGARGRVAGYRTWQTIPAHDGGHCQVQRGAKHLKILAPVTRTAATIDETTGEEEKHRVLVRFKVVRVFDEAALVSPPADPVSSPELLAGQAPGRLVEALETQIQGAGYTLIERDCSPANGETDWATRTVLIRPDLDRAQRAKTLAHELAHVRLHHPSRLDAQAWPRPRKEVEAESVAYLVCSQAGLDSGGYTIPYVALWSGGDLRLVADTADRVIDTARNVTADIAQDLGLPHPEHSHEAGLPSEHPVSKRLTAASLTDPPPPQPGSLDTQHSAASRLDHDAGKLVRHLAANVDQWAPNDPDTKTAIEHVASGMVPPANDRVAAARASIEALKASVRPTGPEPGIPPKELGCDHPDL